jgi:diaminopimelate epimerase
VHLSKHHGLGNDFLVALDECNRDPLCLGAVDAVRLCDRRRGVGADGLIHGARPTPAQVAEGIDVVMHLFNSDGSGAEISGNGIRCLGQAVARARNLTAGVVTVLTDAGPRPLEITAGPDASTVQVSVGMGEPVDGPHLPEAVAEFLTTPFTTVDIGNPHLVIQVDDPDAIDLATEGPWLESQFAGGVNVEFITAAPDRSGLALRVWERGAGITEACGSGACAAAYAAYRWGLVDRRVRVSMPGGDAEVILDVGDRTRATLIGPSVLVADVTVSEATDRVEA